METLHSRIDTITPKLMTEAEYQALATPDPDIWYYTYEEEQP